MQSLQDIVTDAGHARYAIAILRELLSAEELKAADEQIDLCVNNVGTISFIEDYELRNYNSNRQTLTTGLDQLDVSLQIKKNMEGWLAIENIYLKAYIAFSLPTCFKKLSYSILFELTPIFVNNWGDFGTIIGNRIFRDRFIQDMATPVGKNLLTPFFIQLSWSKELNSIRSYSLSLPLTRSFVTLETKSYEDKISVIKYGIRSINNRGFFQKGFASKEEELVLLAKSLMGLDGLPNDWVREALGVIDHEEDLS